MNMFHKGPGVVSNVVQGLINSKGVTDDTFLGWAHFQPKRKELLLGHPGPGLDLGRGGGIKSNEILIFYTWSQGVYFFDSCSIKRVIFVRLSHVLEENTYVISLLKKIGNLVR